MSRSYEGKFPGEGGGGEESDGVGLIGIVSHHLFSVERDLNSVSRKSSKK